MEDCTAPFTKISTHKMSHRKRSEQGDRGIRDHSGWLPHELDIAVVTSVRGTAALGSHSSSDSSRQFKTTAFTGGGTLIDQTFIISTCEVLPHP